MLKINSEANVMHTSRIEGSQKHQSRVNEAEYIYLSMVTIWHSKVHSDEYDKKIWKHQPIKKIQLCEEEYTKVNKLAKKTTGVFLSCP